jgi:guanylate kinase
MKPKLIIVSAPSGAGKTSIVKELLKSGLNLEFSISACSRNKRPAETHGCDYYFLGIGGFKEKIKEDAFIEWEEVYKDHFYGTLKSEVDRISQNGKNVIFDVDVVGGLNIKKLYKENALAIFILPPSEQVLKERLRNRNTESEDKLELRMDKAREELTFASRFDVRIVNDKLPLAIEECKNAILNFINK